MKRSFSYAAILFGFLIISQPMFAQLPVGFKTGFKGGLTFATLRGDTDPLLDISYRQGFSAGVFARISVLGILAVQPEVNFVQKGAEASAETTQGGQTVTFEQKTNVNYLEIPVLLHFSAPVVPTLLDFNFYGGPAMSFKVSEEREATINGNSILDDEEDEDFFTSNDFGLCFGGGINLASPGLPTIMLDVRYVLGLSNVAVEDTDLTEQISLKNGAITASVGLGF